MKDKKRLELATKLQKEQNEYWLGVSLDDIIRIRIKASTGQYVRREAEEFTAIRLPGRIIPGLKQSMRVIPLNASSVTIRHIPLDWIQSIDGKQFQTKTEWKVKGSKGNYYIVRLVGDRYTCTCPGFKYRKQCKHSADVVKWQTQGT